MQRTPKVTIKFCITGSKGDSRTYLKPRERVEGQRRSHVVPFRTHIEKSPGPITRAVKAMKSQQAMSHKIGGAAVAAVSGSSSPMRGGMVGSRVTGPVTGTSSCSDMRDTYGL